MVEAQGGEGPTEAPRRRVFAEDAERREAAAEKRGSGGGGSSVASSSSKKEPAGAGGGGGGAAGAMALSTAAPRRKGSSNSIPTITGPMIDQSTIYPAFTNTRLQDNATEALESFIPKMVLA